MFLIFLFSQQILHYISDLQEDLKDSLILVHVQGLSHAEAAKELGVKESTISWRVHEARKNLKQTFQTSALIDQSTNNDAIRGTA